MNLSKFLGVRFFDSLIEKGRKRTALLENNKQQRAVRMLQTSAHRAVVDVLEKRQLLTAVIGDAGFETVPVGNDYSYDPTGSAWTFSGNSGLTGNDSGFTFSNSGAPEGSQVAFVQETGNASQSITGWNAGIYQLSFDSAQRGSGNNGGQDFEVLLDGAVLGSFTPSSSSYSTLTTPQFSIPTSGSSHTIEFLGLDTAGGDNTAFVDDVVLTPITAPTVGDLGFENVGVGSGYAYNPSGSAWTFSGSSPDGSGITGNNSPFTGSNPLAPQGSQVAFIQETGSISQSIPSWGTGTYQLSFSSAQRGDNNNTGEDFEVLVDQAVVGSFMPGSSSYQTLTTPTFSITTAGTHTIEFLGVDTAGGDNTALIDNVQLVSAPVLPTIGDPSFAAPAQGSGSAAFSYDPSESAWAFSGSSPSGSGLTGNDSPFTNGNPDAPVGSQVAFVQETGTLSQSVYWPTGTYQISFTAAQRANDNNGGEDFQVLVDGVAIGTFDPISTDYQTYTTPAFGVASGPHTIQFVGIDSATGDNTAFLSQVQVNAVSTATPWTGTAVGGATGGVTQTRLGISASPVMEPSLTTARIIPTTAKTLIV
jgi:hypothetical protein